MLAHRCELVDSLFEDIKNKLEEFAKSNKYSGFMTALAEKADKEQAFSKDCVINVGRNDKRLADDIAQNTASVLLLTVILSLADCLFTIRRKYIYRLYA